MGPDGERRRRPPAKPGARPPVGGRMQLTSSPLRAISHETRIAITFETVGGYRESIWAAAVEVSAAHVVYDYDERQAIG